MYVDAQLEWKFMRNMPDHNMWAQPDLTSLSFISVNAAKWLNVLTHCNDIFLTSGPIFLRAPVPTINTSSTLSCDLIGPPAWPTQATNRRSPGFTDAVGTTESLWILSSSIRHRWTELIMADAVGNWMRCTAVHSPMNTTDPQPVGLPPIWSAGECGYKMLSITEIKCEQARNGDPRCTTPLHYTVLGHTYPLLSTNFPDNQSIIWMRVIQFARTGTYLESLVVVKMAKCLQT